MRYLKEYNSDDVSNEEISRRLVSNRLPDWENNALEIRSFVNDLIDDYVSEINSVVSGISSGSICVFYYRNGDTYFESRNFDNWRKLKELKFEYYLLVQVKPSITISTAKEIYDRMVLIKNRACESMNLKVDDSPECSGNRIILHKAVKTDWHRPFEDPHQFFGLYNGFGMDCPINDVGGVSSPSFWMTLIPRKIINT